MSDNESHTGIESALKPAIKNVSIPIQYPMLTDSNYGVWSLKMKYILRSLGLWSIVDGDDVEESREQAAMVAISQALPDDVLMAIAEQQTAKQAWIALREMRVGEDRVKKARVQILRKYFMKTQMEEKETINEFSMRLTTLVSEIRTLGVKLEEREVVEKIFCAVPDRFQQIVGTLEQFADVENMSVAEAIGRLRTFEESLKGKSDSRNSRDQLLFTKNFDGGQSSRREGWNRNNIRGGRFFRGRGSGRFNGRFHENVEKNVEGRRPRYFDKTKSKCFNCNEFGHFARDCPKPNRKEKANLAIHGEEEPILLLSKCCLKTETQKKEDTSGIEDVGRKSSLKVSKDRWYLDSGASNHMTGDLGRFAELDNSFAGTVRLGDGTLVEICGRGTVLMKCSNNEHRALTNVFYIPKLKSNIISIGQLDEAGCSITVKDGQMTIKDVTEICLAKVERSHSRLYVVQLSQTLPDCLLVHADEEAWKWHARYGHINFNSLNMLSKDELVKGLPLIKKEERICDGCLVGKQHRTPFPKTASFRASTNLELWHLDLCGPITPMTFGGKRYFLLGVDDYSRYMWVEFLGNKSEALELLKKMKSAAEINSGAKLKSIRTDRGGEFNSGEFRNFCNLEGIKHFLTAPYSPQQNGVVERRNQTIVGMARCLLKTKNLPSEFWAEAITTAVYLLNRAVTKSVDGKTPYEAFHGRRPDVSHLRIFGCVGHVKVTIPNLPKLADRSKRMVLLGYAHNTKAYRMYDPEDRRVVISRDVVFNEKDEWKWNSNVSGHETRNEGPKMTYKFIVLKDDEEEGKGMTQDVTIQEPVEINSGREEAEQIAQGSTDKEPHVQRRSDFSLTSVRPRGEREIKSIYEATSPIIENQNFSCLYGEEEPNSYEEASKDLVWQAAMKEEIDTIISNNTWSLEEKPAGQNVVGLKWIFKIKKDAAGRTVKHKARLVAKGYSQRAGIDYDEVFAPVARLESIRLVISVAATRSWPIHHLDVKSAFLNGDLNEDVFVAQPQGFVMEGAEDKVLKLNKALYGLKQAPRAWNAKLHKTLEGLNLRRLENEHAIYNSKVGNHLMIVGVYVDDLIVTGSNPSGIEEFKSQMRENFSMSDLGLLSYYLGIEVKQEPNQVTLMQTSYATKLLEKCGMAASNPTLIPMEPRLKMLKDSPEVEVDASHYRSLIGSLRYLLHTRPDLCFSVGVVSRFMERPTKEHMGAVKHILRYIRGSLNYGLVYKKEKEQQGLIGFSDSDLAGDVNDRKSTSGSVFFLNSNPISWSSKKQKIVALSSCEAEYVAASSAACHGVWLSRLLGEMTGEEIKSVTLKIDNQSAIALTKNSVYHDRSKHIDTKYHFIRDCIEEGLINVEHVRTEEQHADIMTKALAKGRFCEMREKIGVHEVTLGDKLTEEIDGSKLVPKRSKSFRRSSTADPRSG